MTSNFRTDDQSEEISPPLHAKKADRSRLTTVSVLILSVGLTLLVIGWITVSNFLIYGSIAAAAIALLLLTISLRGE